MRSLRWLCRPGLLLASTQVRLSSSTSSQSKKNNDIKESGNGKASGKDSPTSTKGIRSPNAMSPVDSSASSSSSSVAAGTPGKVKRRSGSTGTAAAAAAVGPRSTKDIRVRRKDPWGVQQLRDSWSEDAMTKRETENMSERIHREYRYHPDEQRRHYIKYTALMTLPLLVLSWAVGYYHHTGKPPWEADPQHLLNLLRAADTSPRSRLYLYKLDEMDELPEHVRRHREKHAGEREWWEQVFAVTHSAFARPSEDDLRRMEMEMEMKMEMEEEEVEGNEEVGGEVESQEERTASKS